MFATKSHSCRHRLGLGLTLGVLAPHALLGEGNEVRAVGHAVEVQRPAHDGEEEADERVLLHQPGEFLVGLLELLLGVPRVRVVLVDVVVELVVLAVGELLMGREGKAGVE